MLDKKDNKIKIYLDTSVVSYLQQDDAPDKMATTLKLWKKFKNGVYDVYLSQITLNEISECNNNKLIYLKHKLSEIEYTILHINQETYKLANRIIEQKILTEKSFDDCQHIAVALENNCDVILSWNFKHLVNIKTIQGIRTITNVLKNKSIEIMTPESLMEMEENKNEIC